MTADERRAKVREMLTADEYYLKEPPFKPTIDELVDQLDALYRDWFLELIGEDEPENGFGKRDGEYEMHYHRNDLRAELRQQLTAALDNSEREMK
jgi:hypothetical protein